MIKMRAIKLTTTPNEGRDKYIQFPQIATASLETPASTNEGGLVYDSTTNTLKFSDGASWTALSTATSVGTLQQVTTAGKTSNVVAVEFTGASSAANGVLIGDGTRKLQLYTDGTDSFIGSASGDIKMVPNGGDVSITGTLAVSSTFSAAGITSTGAFTVGADGTGHDVIFWSDTAGDSVKFNDTEKCMVWEDCSIQMNDSDYIQLGSGTGIASGDFAIGCDGTDLIIIANAAVVGQAIRIGGATNEVDLVWNSTTAGAEVTFDSDAVATIWDGVSIVMNDEDVIKFGDNSDFGIYYADADKDIHLVAYADVADQCLHIGDATNDIDIQWYGDTSGDLIKFDSSEDSVTFTDIDLIIAESGAECALDVSSAATGADGSVIKGTGALTDGYAVLGVKGTGNIATGGAVLNLDYATGTPHADARILEIQGSSKDLRAIVIDVDSATSHCIDVNCGGELAAGKAVLYVAGDAAINANADLVRLDGSNGTFSTNNPNILHVYNGGTGYTALLESTNTGAVGAVLALRHNGTNEANDDVVARIQFIGQDDANAAESAGRIDSIVRDVTAANPDFDMQFYVDVAGTETLRLELPYDVNGIIAGSGAATSFIEGAGAQSLVIRNNGGTNSPTITLANGAASNMTLFAPTTGSIELAGTDTGARGVNLILSHHPSDNSEANDDVIARIQFEGQDDANADENYGRIDCVIRDITAANPDADIQFYTDVAGTETLRLELNNWGVEVGTGAAAAYFGAAGAQNLIVQVNQGGNSPTVQLNSGAAGGIVLTAATTGSVEVAGVDNGARGGQLIISHHPGDGSEANDDVIGRIQFEGQDNADADENYGKIDCVVRDITAANPDSDIQFYVDVAGTETLRLEIPYDINGIYVGDGAATAIVSSAGSRELDIVTGGGNVDIVLNPAGTGKIVPVNTALANADNTLMVPVLMRYYVTAGANAQDIAIYNANCPRAMIIADVWTSVETADAGETITLRTAGAGGGNPITSDLSVNATALVRTTTLSSPENQIAANGSLYIRNSAAAPTSEYELWISGFICG